MSENLIGKSLRVRLRGPLPPTFQQAWKEKVSVGQKDVDFVPVICGVLQSIDSSLNLVLENVHIGAICTTIDSDDGRELVDRLQIESFASVFIRGSNIQFAQIE